MSKHALYDTRRATTTPQLTRGAAQDMGALMFQFMPPQAIREVLHGATEVAPPLLAEKDVPTPSSDDGEDKAHYRTVFISDVHLGTAGCQAAALLDFLKHHPSESLYLVGDIIDGWQLRRRWFWPQSHNDVVQKILRRARKGCKVVLVPGNHDEFARQFHAHHFGGIEVLNEAVHTTATGQRLWVVHGDLYDGVVQYAKWLAYVGDYLYDVLLKVNRHFNSWRAKIGLPYWSLSQYLKHKVKQAVNFVSDFETAVAKEARDRGFDGVVCGHIHRPEMRHIDGILYCNDGDWVESLSALVEHMDGRLELVHWLPPGHVAEHQRLSLAKASPNAAQLA